MKGGQGAARCWPLVYGEEVEAGSGAGGEGWTGGGGRVSHGWAQHLVRPGILSLSFRLIAFDGPL